MTSTVKGCLTSPFKVKLYWTCNSATLTHIIGYYSLPLLRLLRSDTVIGSAIFVQFSRVCEAWTINWYLSLYRIGETGHSGTHGTVEFFSLQTSDQRCI